MYAALAGLAWRIFHLDALSTLVPHNSINYACVVKVRHTPSARVYVAVLCIHNFQHSTGTIIPAGAVNKPSVQSMKFIRNLISNSSLASSQGVTVVVLHMPCSNTVVIIIFWDCLSKCQAKLRHGQTYQIALIPDLIYCYQLN